MSKNFTFEPEMPECPSVDLTMEVVDGNCGNTRLVFGVGAGLWRFEADGGSVTIDCDGSWERQGLIEALEFALKNLKDHQ